MGFRWLGVQSYLLLFIKGHCQSRLRPGGTTLRDANSYSWAKALYKKINPVVEDTTVGSVIVFVFWYSASLHENGGCGVPGLVTVF